MCLGALLSAGAPLAGIEKALKKLRLRGVSITERAVRRSGIKATKVDVSLRGKGLTGWDETRAMITRSDIPPEIKAKGLAIFKDIFRAESRVHGAALRKTRLHELADSVVDIMGTLVALEILRIKKVFFSPVNLGSGQVKTVHGALPVPAPATIELLKGIPVYSDGTPYELTTPTGAALVKALSSGFGPMPSITPLMVGTGAGGRDIRGKPNVLRVFIGEEPAEEEPNITVIETNIDDMSPQVYEYVMERLFEDGALDAYLTQVLMKKGRPGVLLTVLCHEDKRDALIKTVFMETTTIGVRFREAGRRVLERSVRKIKTKYGRVRVKEVRLPEGGVRVSAEYEDLKEAARKRKRPLIDVMRLSSK